MTQTPYKLDDAVEDEKAFWRQVRSIIREEVELAVGPTVDKVDLVYKSQQGLMRSFSSLDARVRQTSDQIDRLSSWATQRGLFEEGLAKKLERFFEIIPPLPDKTPPHG